MYSPSNTLSRSLSRDRAQHSFFPFLGDRQTEGAASHWAWLQLLLACLQPASGLRPLRALQGGTFQPTSTARSLRYPSYPLSEWSSCSMSLYYLLGTEI